MTNALTEQCVRSSQADGMKHLGLENIIVHIGFHKSASTFLQKNVFPQLSANYLFFAGKNNNRDILDYAESTSGFDAGIIRKWVKSELIKKYNTVERTTTILSHEELSGHPHGHGEICPYTTARNLHKAFPQARILIVIRNQIDYLTSIYAFRVLRVGHESRSFDQFITEEGAKGLFNHLEYHRLVEYYHGLFGPDRILVLPMELLSRSTSDFCARICSFMQVPHQGIDKQQRMNATTKSQSILSFWRPINFLFGLMLDTLVFVMRKREERYPFRRFRFYFYNARSRITELVENKLFASRKIRIDEYSGYSKLMSRFGESNKQLEELLHTDLSSMGYPKAPESDIIAGRHSAS